MMQVIDAIAARGPGVSLRTGVVTVTGTTCTITLAGATLAGIPRLASYSPTVSDVVLILQAGAQLVIIGKTA
jgi:hypothetical protein